MTVMERLGAGEAALIPPGSDEVFAADVLAGLSKPQKELPCRWFYDTRGSELFEQITDLPEYYPTRTETAILRDCVAELSALVGPGVGLIEYGAGAAVKTRILLDGLDAPGFYAPIDISAEFLHSVAETLAKDYPAIAMHPIVGNFLSDLEMPGLETSGLETSGLETSGLELSGALPSAGRRLGFFPGSTIGNLSDAEIDAFLARARRQLGTEGMLLIGADLRKSPDILIPAYDDAAGVTAAFNKNLLVRINRELGADFELSQFRHAAVWNDAESRIEMHLVSARAQSVSLLGRRFEFVEGESIHTENSRKFTLQALQARAAASGWMALRSWQDPSNLFSLLLFR